MRFAAKLAVLWFCIMVSLPGSRAHADEAKRVVLVGSADDDLAAERMRRELDLLGLVVVLERHDVDGDLAELAHRHHAIAAIRSRKSPSSMSIWVDPSQTQAGAALAPQVSLDMTADSTKDPSLVVIRAIELLRARLLLPEAAPRPIAETRSDRAVPPPFAPKSAERPKATKVATATQAPRQAAPLRTPSAFAGAALVASPGGVPPALSAALGARFRPISRLELEAIAFVPVTEASVAVPQGSAGLRTAVLGIGAAALLTDPGRDLFATAGLGGGAALLFFRGNAAPPNVGAEGVRVVAMPYAHAAAGYWIARHVALRADLTAGLMAPRPVLQSAGREAASVDAPVVFLSLGAEVGR